VDLRVLANTTAAQEGFPTHAAGDALTISGAEFAGVVGGVSVIYRLAAFGTDSGVEDADLEREARAVIVFCCCCCCVDSLRTEERCDGDDGRGKTLVMMIAERRNHRSSKRIVTVTVTGVVRSNQKRIILILLSTTIIVVIIIVLHILGRERGMISFCKVVGV